MPRNADQAWLAPALAYIDRWMTFQLERHEQVGASIAIKIGQAEPVTLAFGLADRARRRKLTPAHRFRVASHSKSFTAAAILLLRDQGRLHLDERIGRWIDGLDPAPARARIGQLLSHSAGVTRDGLDSGQFRDRHPFLNQAQLRAALALAQPLEAGVQLKYSNHGYGLLGLVIEAVTGEPYDRWVLQHVVRAAGLRDTVPDISLLPARTRMALGYSGSFPFGRRLTIPGTAPCHAMAPAAGFVSTAADMTRFFAQLDPAAPKSVLSVESRREMTRRRWQDEYSADKTHYGLGLMMNGSGVRSWFGHTGGFQGFVSRTSHYPKAGMTLSVLCNAIDGWSWAWTEGVFNILHRFSRDGAGAAALRDWEGRWWSLWGASDLVAVGHRLLAVSPAMTNPFDDHATEIEVTGRDRGLLTRTSAFNSPGETVRRDRNARGQVDTVWLGGARMRSRAAMVREAQATYQEGMAPPTRARRAGRATGG